MTATDQHHLLAFFGAEGDEKEELLRYSSEKLFPGGEIPNFYVLEDEPFVSAWEEYASRVQRDGGLLALVSVFPQLRFPLGEHLSSDPEYLAATRRGSQSAVSSTAGCLHLESPSTCRIDLRQTMAGKLPIVRAGSRKDFETLVQAFTMRGKPQPLPASMGAVIVGNYNNFHRARMKLEQIHDYKEDRWPSLAAAILQLGLEKQDYQDRFVLVGPGGYSGVKACEVALSEQDWLNASMNIRIEHECTHYFTRRVFGRMRNHLLDELLADFCGVEAAMETYLAEWALRFLGVEKTDEYRSGGRLENYRGDPPMSQGAFEILQKLVRACVANLQLFSKACRTGANDLHRVAAIYSIASCRLDELASPQGAPNLKAHFERYVSQLQVRGDRLTSASR